MKTPDIRLIGPLAVSILLLHCPARCSAGSFEDFVKKDRQEQRDFNQGKTKAPAKSAKDAAPATPDKQIQFQREEPAKSPVVAKQAAPPAVHPDAARALDIYLRYCRARNRLDDPDPEKGLNAGIKILEEHLFPTGRPWVDYFSHWSEEDRDVRWPQLKDMRVRRGRLEAEVAALEEEWANAGLDISIGTLGANYCRKIWISYLDRKADTFPSPIRSNQVDYVIHRIDSMWPTAETPAVDETASKGRKDPVYEKPPVVPDPPKPDKCEVTTTNVPPKKAWEVMTDDERHEALKANDPDAWTNVRDALLSGDTNKIQQVKDALGASGKSAEPPPIAITNLTPTEVAVVKPWKDMTPQERHEALKKGDPAAWDAVRDALLSGNADQINAVVQALGAQAIADVLIATAYWHGFQLGVQEKLTQAEESQLDVVAAAYKDPKLAQMVRKGFADGQAGNPPEYELPTSFPGAPTGK